MEDALAINHTGCVRSIKVIPPLTIGASLVIDTNISRCTTLVGYLSSRVCNATRSKLYPRMHMDRTSCHYIGWSFSTLQSNAIYFLLSPHLSQGNQISCQPGITSVLFLSLPRNLLEKMLAWPFFYHRSVKELGQETYLHLNQPMQVYQPIHITLRFIIPILIQRPCKFVLCTIIPLPRQLYS
jgi:hypothetical protein